MPYQFKTNVIRNAYFALPSKLEKKKEILFSEETSRHKNAKKKKNMEEFI